MAKVSLKPGTMLNPLPAVMVSCSDGDLDNVLTIAWTGIINSEPPITYVSVRKSRYSHQLIEKSGEFVINLVNEELACSADYCGVKSGRNEDKFAKCNLSKMPADHVKAPLIKESPVNLECKVLEIKEYQTHDMFPCMQTRNFSMMMVEYVWILQEWLPLTTGSTSASRESPLEDLASRS